MRKNRYNSDNTDYMSKSITESGKKQVVLLNPFFNVTHIIQTYSQKFEFGSYSNRQVGCILPGLPTAVCWAIGWCCAVGLLPHGLLILASMCQSSIGIPEIFYSWCLWLWGAPPHSGRVAVAVMRVAVPWFAFIPRARLVKACSNWVYEENPLVAQISPIHDSMGLKIMTLRFQATFPGPQWGTTNFLHKPKMNLRASLCYLLAHVMICPHMTVDHVRTISHAPYDTGFTCGQCYSSHVEI